MEREYKVGELVTVWIHGKNTRRLAVVIEVDILQPKGYSLGCNVKLLDLPSNGGPYRRGQVIHRVYQSIYKATLTDWVEATTKGYLVNV